MYMYFMFKWLINDFQAPILHKFLPLKISTVVSFGHNLGLEVLCSDGGDYEDRSFLAYRVLQSCWSRPTFQRCVLPLSSLWWWRQYAHLKCLYIWTRLHGAIFQNAVIFKITVVTNMIYPNPRPLWRVSLHRTLGETKNAHISFFGKSFW
jgi:hypothetical protein